MTAPALVFINKTARSKKLSSSHSPEKAAIYSHVQRACPNIRRATTVATTKCGSSFNASSTAFSKTGSIEIPDSLPPVVRSSSFKDLHSQDRATRLDDQLMSGCVAMLRMLRRQLYYFSRVCPHHLLCHILLHARLTLFGPPLFHGTRTCRL